MNDNLIGFLNYNYIPMSEGQCRKRKSLDGNFLLCSGIYQGKRDETEAGSETEDHTDDEAEDHTDDEAAGKDDVTTVR
jgi:hypothetical protein